jgi:hypothetical protein
MPHILDAVSQFLKDSNWPFTPMDDPSLLQMVYRGKNGSWACYARAREEHSQFIFYSVAPLTTPESSMLEVAEYLIRVNYGLMIGNFDLDFADGEVRCKTGISVEGASLTPPLIQSVVYANVLMMDRYLPGLTAVMTGYLTPEEAYRDAEKQDR